MTTCLGNSCLFGLLCMSFVNVYPVLCPSFPFGIEGVKLDVIVLIPDLCRSTFLFTSVVVPNICVLLVSMFCFVCERYF